MLQFITASEHSLNQLERRCQRACVCFSDQPLPPGSDPTSARVGFEVDPASGQARLLVDRGVRYEGPDAQIARWLAQGELRFEDFSLLCQWVRATLGATYDQPAAPGSPDPPRATYLDQQRLLEALGQRVRGQDAALEVLAGQLCRHLARVHPRRPAVLFAVGPTGVGKTLAATVLPAALEQLGCEPAWGLVRLDMTEYQERHRVSQLLGAPQGYVGHGEGSQLVDALVADPRQIVLFDEIEKAHPAILRALMNAMDAGRLSTAERTAAGRELDCSRCVFIFTSNVDAEAILQDLEPLPGDRAAEDEVCRRRLREAKVAPEIVGRISRFLVFRPLTDAIRREVTELAVVEVAQEYGLQVERVAPGAVVAVLDLCPTASYGARTDRYLVDDLLGPALAAAAQRDTDRPVEVALDSQGALVVRASMSAP